VAGGTLWCRGCVDHLPMIPLQRCKTTHASVLPQRGALLAVLRRWLRGAQARKNHACRWMLSWRISDLDLLSDQGCCPGSKHGAVRRAWCQCGRDARLALQVAVQALLRTVCSPQPCQSKRGAASPMALALCVAHDGCAPHALPMPGLLLDT